MSTLKDSEIDADDSRNAYLQVVRNLILEGHEVHVVTGAPAHIFTTEIQSPKLFIRKVDHPLSPNFFCNCDNVGGILS